MKYFVWLEFMIGFFLAVYGVRDDNTWMRIIGASLVSSAVYFITSEVYKKEQK